jgi:TonB family protein
MQLDRTKNIDRYLSGELSAADRASFEEQLKSNPELQQEVDLQLLIQEASIRASFRADVRHAARKYRLNRILKWGAAGLGTLAVIVATTVWVSSRKQTETQDQVKVAPTIALSMMEELSPNADFAPLPIQYFSVPKEGDVFLSDQSVLLSVPEKAFMLEGKIYRGEAIVQFQEALEAHEIVKAGLNTKSGTDLLETQGMFSIHAYTPEGDQLEINPEVGVYVQVPVNEYKEGMQLYDYVDLGNGQADWQNPRALSRIPVPVDMKELDFYPEGYEDKLDQLKWKRAKLKRDSLYLSFENYCTTTTSNQNTTNGTSSKNLLRNEQVVSKPSDPVYNMNTMVVDFPDVEARFPGGTAYMRAYIKENIEYPQKAIERGLSGRTYIGMEVDIYGFITNVKVVRSSHPILDKEALRVVYSMPQWIPAQVKGKAVRSKVRFPIDFNLENLETNIRQNGGAEMMLVPNRKDRLETLNRVEKGLRIQSESEGAGKSVSVHFDKLNDRSGSASVRKSVSVEGLEGIQEERPQEDLTSGVMSDSTALEDTPCDYPRINPSRVLAFWKPKFNNTNLATREFERRMKAIHGTCDEAVLKQYTSQLSKPISEIDRIVARMGYSEFSAFADEQVGAVDPNNPHLENIKAFYEEGIATLKEKAESNKNWEQQLRSKWDNHLAKLRSAHSVSTKKQTEQSLKEETSYNQRRTVQKMGLKNQRRMNPVATYPQFRRTIGFTARRSGGYNCDAPVNRVVTYQTALRSAQNPEVVQSRKIARVNVEVDVKNGTETRETFSVTEFGRTRTITYNSLSFAIRNPEKYNKIMAYAFPHQLSTYQLLEGENGNYITSLNDDIIYDICIVGMTEDGYEYFQKQTLNGGSLGTIELKKISESKLDASLIQLNAKRNSKATSFKNELDWIKAEKKYFKEVDRRQKMDQFRETIATVIYPCYSSQEGESEEEASAEAELPESAGFPVRENSEDVTEDQATIDAFE